MITDRLINNSGTNVVNQTEINSQINGNLRSYASNSLIITGTGGNTVISTGSNTTGSFTINTSSMYTDKRLLNVVIKDITIEILYRESPMYAYTIVGANSTQPDRIWKEIYGLSNGKMTLLEVVQGKHVLAYSVPESFVFDDDPDTDSPNGLKEE